MRVFNPVYSSTSDGSDITLCRILEAAASIQESIGDGGATSANPAVGPDGVTRVPLNVNSDGELKVNVEASINADLTTIENKQDTTNGLLTTTSSDLALVKASASSIAGFSIPAYDNIVLSYTSNNLTGVVYKVGATVVGTLTLSYDGSNQLTGVVKS
jgi:hypothetical protein